MFNKFLSSVAYELKLLLAQLLLAKLLLAKLISSFSNGLQIVKHFFFIFQVVGLCVRAIINCIHILK